MQGVRDADSRKDVISKFQPFPYMEVSRDTWEHVGALSAGLRKNGKSIPITDLILAALAIENNAPVYTIDPHFDDIPNLKFYK